MADFDNRLMRGAAAATTNVDAGLRAYMLRGYNYMLVGLGLTGAVAWLTANTPLRDVFFAQVATPYGITLQPNMLGWVAIFAPIAMVLFLSFRIQKMSFPAAQGTFWGYAALMGVSLSTIFFAYTGASIAMTFFVTAATFGAMSLYGYTTGRDLTGFGSFLMMGMFGIFIAMIANMFFRSPAMDFAISVLGVLIFTGLTAWDTQNIKNMYYGANVGQWGRIGNTAGMQEGNLAIIGALRLYLDFINLFMFLLRFMGNSRR